MVAQSINNISCWMGTLTEDLSVPLGRVGVRGCCIDLQRDGKKNQKTKTTARCREDNARVGPSTFHFWMGRVKSPDVHTIDNGGKKLLT